MRYARMVLLLALTALLGGCGAELLAGGYGEVEAEATDDAGASQHAAPADGPRFSAAQALLPQGTLELTTSLALVAEDGAVVPITAGMVTRQLAIAAADTVALGSEDRVAAGVYPTVRLSVSRMAADVQQGLIIGDVSVEGVVEVAIGAGALVVDIPAQVVVRQGERTVVVVDLNAPVWLAAADPVTSSVPAAAFRSAVTVSTR